MIISVSGSRHNVKADAPNQTSGILILRKGQSQELQEKKIGLTKERTMDLTAWCIYLEAVFSETEMVKYLPDTLVTARKHGMFATGCLWR